jgi:alpha-glucosidase
MGGFFFRKTAEGFEAGLDGKVLIEQRLGLPFLRAGRGAGTYEMYRGNFRIAETIDEAIEPLRWSVEAASGDAARLLFSRGGKRAISVTMRGEAGRLVARFSEVSGGAAPQAPSYNRFRISLPGSGSEHIYGCGEQFSHLDLKGRNFPLWTSEQGVGRNKATEITRLADLDGGSGGDYFWTFFPQASFVSSRGYWCGLDTAAYAEFDFRTPGEIGLYSWALPASLVIGAAETLADTVSDLSAWYGRQKALPAWCHDGVILGIQGGTGTCLEKLAKAKAAGVPVAGIWAQDWQGINVTSFGQRLRWNWVWDEVRYPGLDKEIRALKGEGVRFLGYINPYVGAGMSLFREAAAAGYLAKDSRGADYLVDFGEFDAGIVDLTNPLAFEWYKGVIKKNLIGFGLSGWMADFGEYLPTDAILHSGVSAELAHNEWPALWARCNREAVDEAEREGLVAEGEIFYFMRAGGAGSQKYCPMMWAGDQNVDWSEDDGLPSVIPAALSLGMSGHGLHHSDIGGYTTLYGMRRTKELFMRWVEQAAFTALMRSHEGNRPAENWHFDSDGETLAHLARMTRLHRALKPYLLHLEKENSELGLPLMRPIFLHHEDDGKAWAIKDEYLLGEDLLVAPVLVEGAVAREIHLPDGEWVHLWSGKSFRGGECRVDAPLGEPPVFAKAATPWMEAFKRAIEAC